ncbi:MAG: hypothetical protein J6S96_07460 [Muribaculaceae bacterium]|nr:hypothetical protein [Muribaculaceae bacterium]
MNHVTTGQGRNMSCRRGRPHRQQQGRLQRPGRHDTVLAVHIGSTGISYPAN